MTNNKQPRILITGATGNIGTVLSQQLATWGIPFTAMVRSAEDSSRFDAIPGASTVVGDFDKPEQLKTILTGFDKAFLLTNSSEKAEQQQKQFVQAAIVAGIKHIVKLSQWEADINSPVRFLRYHAAVEAAIRQSGISYTFLRPNLFMQGLLGFRDLIIHQQQFFASLGDAPVSLIDIRDIAAVAAAALTQEGHTNKTYSLTGPEALSHQQMAEILSEETGKTIQFHNVPGATLKGALLSAGFPEWQAEGLIEDYDHYGRREAEQVTNDIQQVTGQPPRTFRQFVHEHKNLFS
ncbi:SDR family oxidoreductase [Chitinophaga pendula]|uniref:SDR family oxidoreductase n=1 Tax=Chitinophaga TaxID=79328 RepID=UPI000BAF1632|nr:MULTISPECIES: SDR family oxidoreductase [Chitinophaga]ASZ12298.1 NAD(P)-dependent oxidoreductase [Chitinophaga sp. MD30]UCJ10113.1 SDR family oxidoreductase [Chitinophaga pendula]